MNKRKWLRRGAWALLLFFVLVNIIAFNQAWRFTHYTSPEEKKTSQAERLTLTEKLKTIFMGVNNPRPQNKEHPSQLFETVTIQDDKKLEAWYVRAEHPLGTVILFHGYAGCKGSMIDKSDEFLKMNYNTLLVDFRGSGGSEGNQTTVGYYEANDVKASYNWVLANGEKNIILFGTSMGAVAILKCLALDNLSPKGVILECPYGSLYQTTEARFRLMGLPSFPMAALLDFWGGVQNGFWAFSLEPTGYAKHVRCPSLLLWGGKDPKVSRAETDEIFSNLQGRKTLKIYPEAGHENYLRQYGPDWVLDVQGFLDSLK